MRHGSSQQRLTPTENRASANVIGGMATALFFANCAMPYFGLKTAQAVNMFSNLRLEAGVSNHLVMKNVPKPFKYLEDVAKVTEVTPRNIIATYDVNERAEVYYDLLAFVSDTPGAVVSYTRNGKAYKNMTADTLSEDIETILHPKWFRKWFHFRPVRLTEPRICG